MNKIFTLFTLGMVCLFANKANAQVSENFNAGLATLNNNCWKFNNMSTIGATNGKLNPIEGDSSLKQTSPGAMGEISTPFYDLTSDINISFVYKLSSKLANGATRRIEVGLTDKNNVFTAIGNAIILDGNSPFQKDNDPSISFNRTIQVSGTNRITVRISSLNGDGNSVLYIDGLQITTADASLMKLHYASSCNTLPQAVNDNYITAGYSLQHFTNSVLSNDSDNDNGETLTAEIVTQSVDGVAVMAADGTFTFKPNTGFIGTSTTFTYRAIDNGFEPASRVATVTINFVDGIILPIAFTTFSGNANGGKAQLTWSVAANETGNYFEVEKSTDGKNYQPIATVMTTNNAGADKYAYTDAAFFTGGSFYRIKAINKDNTTSYSKTVFIKGTTVTDNKITLMQNPVNSSLNFSFTAATDEANEIAIYNLAGVKMYSQKMQARKGANSISINLDNMLVRGNYILTVNSASAIRSIQLIKQ